MRQRWVPIGCWAVLLCTTWLGGLWSRSWAIPTDSPHVKAELIAETAAIRPGMPFWVAIRFELEEHWHTYWQNPGDSGQPTSVTWDLPPGFVADAMQWPIPKRIAVSGLVGYGYETEVLHLVRLTPPSDLPVGKPVTLASKVKWLVCKEACIPGEAELSLTLPVTSEAPPPSAWVEAFARTRAQLPLPTSDWKLRATVDGDAVVLLLTPPTPEAALTEATFFPFEELVIEGAEVQTLTRVKGGYALRMVRSKVAEAPPARLAGVVVTPEGWRGPGTEPGLAVDVAVEPPTALGDALAPVAGATQPTAPAAPPLGWAALVATLGGAFLGGLILNLMPCVLPVLSIKVLGFVEQARAGRGKAWQHGVVFAAGVVLSFWALAGALLALRAGGQQLGWGFQLQEPAFVAFLIAVLFVFGLVLFGVFEVGVGLAAVGQEAMGRTGLAGSFFTGALATVVATPCTAPFMGSALGVALAQPAAVALLIFTALALGLASPYLLLAAAPQLLRFVPRPGAWMESFKQLMGFLLMGSVVWLLWVLGLEVGVDGLALMLGALVLIGLGGWIWGRWGRYDRTPLTRRIALAAATVIIVGSTGAVVNAIRQFPLPANAATGTSSDKGSTGIQWEVFTPSRLAELRRNGKPVFVDFTAAWCLSCKANEKVALENTEVRAEIARRGIIMVKADWTNRDENITRALAEFGRSGVPLYVFYPPNGGEPKVLPEVLTPGLVLETFRTAS